jgi:hypothetical protein
MILGMRVTQSRETALSFRQTAVMTPEQKVFRLGAKAHTVFSVVTPHLSAGLL